MPGADALVTATPGVLLTLFFADCVPVYFVDPVNKAVGLAHAGWRGAASNIAAKTLQTMTEQFGSQPASCLAAVGPCIGGDSYEVGPEVADRFRSIPGARATNSITPRSEFGGTYSLNLRQVVFGQLLYAGIRAQSIAVCDEDTYRNKRDFFLVPARRGDGPHGGFFGDEGDKTRVNGTNRWFLIVGVGPAHCRPGVSEPGNQEGLTDGRGLAAASPAGAERFPAGCQ